RLHESDRIAVVANLYPGIQLLPWLSVAVPEVAMVVGEDDVARVRDRGSVPVEIDLLNAIVAVRHDHGGRRSRPTSRAVEPTPKRRPVRVELDVSGLVRRIRAEHASHYRYARRRVKHC